MSDLAERADLRIGDVARRAGVSTRALRYYEEQGLLPTERTPAGQRVYDASAVDRVRFIQQLYAAGLSSRTILSVLPCIDAQHATPEVIDVLESERNRISHAISDLEQAREQLDRMIAFSHRPDAEACTTDAAEVRQPRNAPR